MNGADRPGAGRRKGSTATDGRYDPIPGLFPRRRTTSGRSDAKGISRETGSQARRRRAALGLTAGYPGRKKVAHRPDGLRLGPHVEP
jgi:hypothetical protein